MTLLCLIFFQFGVAASDDRTILILGDSLSAGYGIDVDASWPQLLQDRLADLGRSDKVHNASISGDTTSGGLARLPRLLKKHEPEIVVIELGANDGLRGIAISEAERNFERMFSLIEPYNAQILVLEMRLPPNFGPANNRQFENLFQALADYQNVRIVPFFLHNVALDPTLMQNDGLHPNALAQPKMMENVWVYLEELL